MPNRPKKIKRPWKPERPAFYRERSNQKFYNSTKWRKKSKSHREKNPFCQMECKEKGIVTAATMTDHIIPINEGGDPFADENLQSGCERCHNRKSGREAHKNKY